MKEGVGWPVPVPTVAGDGVPLLGVLATAAAVDAVLLLLLFKIEHYSRFAYKGRTESR